MSLVTSFVPCLISLDITTSPAGFGILAGTLGKPIALMTASLQALEWVVQALLVRWDGAFTLNAPMPSTSEDRADFLEFAVPLHIFFYIRVSTKHIHCLDLQV